MRTLALSVLTMVTAFGATAADAQRIAGGNNFPGATYPVPGRMPMMQQPGGNVPVVLPPPPQVNTMPRAPHGDMNHQMNGPRPYPNQMNAPRPYPGQMNGPRPYPGQMNPGQNYPGQAYPGTRPAPNGGGSRWGGSYSGRWSGGWNAPGGWNAYRRPTRGYRLPSYWVSPNFFISDFGGYGLYAPPQGYGWQRYYDDAVLVDSRGRVRDSVDGIDWDGAYGYGYGDGGYAQGGYSSTDYGYAQSGAGSSGYAYQTLPPVVQGGGVTTYSTSNGYSAGGYYSGGYYYPGTSTTVVTINSAPSVTTTTTEYVEETRTRYVAPRRVYRVKKVYHPIRCSCRRPKPVERPVLGS